MIHTYKKQSVQGIAILYYGKIVLFFVSHIIRATIYTLCWLQHLKNVLVNCENCCIVAVLRSWSLVLRAYRLICGSIDSLQRTDTKNMIREPNLMLSFSNSFPQKEERYGRPLSTRKLMTKMNMLFINMRCRLSQAVSHDDDQKQAHFLLTFFLYVFWDCLHFFL